MSSQINKDQALAIAQVAFGEHARIRETPGNGPAQFRISYQDPGAAAVTVGYGTSWAQALQRSFITERGQKRIAEKADYYFFSYVTGSETAGTQDDTLRGVQVDTSLFSSEVYEFEYDALKLPWLIGHPRNELSITDLPYYTIPNLIPTPENPVPTAVEVTVNESIAPINTMPARPKPAPIQVAAPRAYVNPASIKTGLLGWDDDVTPAATLAAITGEHLLIVGPPGVAKSLFARRFFGNFEGRLFETQLSKYSDETALFGAPNLKRLREDGVFEYPKHGLAACEWAFLDEFFDASDVLMRTTLGILQEKKFTKGGHEEDIPLNSVIATANYTRVNEITAAVVDRFAITCASPTLTLSQREMLYSSKDYEALPPIPNQIGQDQLKALRAQSKQVEIPQAIIKALVSWTTEMGFTPRRERKLASIIRAAAALAGRRKADENDIMAARFCVPISNSGKVENAGKSLQPLKDAIMQSLHEGEDLRKLDALAGLFTVTGTNTEDIIKAIRQTRDRIKELRGFTCVSEKVNKKREQALTAHEANQETLTRALDI